MGCCHVVLRIQDFRVKCLHLKDGGVWLPGRWKGKKPRFSFPTTRLKVRESGTRFWETALGIPFPVML